MPPPPSRSFFAIVRSASDNDGDDRADAAAGTGTGGGARYGDGGIPTAGLPGEGKGELSDFSDSRSIRRSRSISSFFLRCSSTNAETDASPRSDGGGTTVREIWAADVASMSRTSLRSRSLASAACLHAVRFRPRFARMKLLRHNMTRGNQRTKICKSKSKQAPLLI